LTESVATGTDVLVAKAQRLVQVFSLRKWNGSYKCLL